MPYILYEGPSKIDNAPLVVLAAGIHTRSKNSKTGDMVQTYILRADKSPIEAQKDGDDYSICGNCQHRKTSCYVNIAQGPRAIWASYKRGNNKTQALEHLGGDRLVRLGAYGDPSAVPIHIWESLCRFSKGHTGYTNSWNEPWCDQKLKKYCMASVNNEDEAQRAAENGWRYFRVKTPDMGKLKGEAVCPASQESGKLLQCMDCLACDGTAKKRRGNIVINVHGVAHKIAKFEEETQKCLTP